MPCRLSQANPDDWTRIHADATKRIETLVLQEEAAEASEPQKCGRCKSCRVVGSIYERVSRSVCNTPTFNLCELLDVTEVGCGQARCRVDKPQEALTAIAQGRTLVVSASDLLIRASMGHSRSFGGCFPDSWMCSPAFLGFPGPFPDSCLLIPGFRAGFLHVYLVVSRS